jgi:lipopolysaccharide export system permease protein
MRRLDKYIAQEFAPLLVFGVGAFMVILVGVDLLPHVLRLVVRESFPLSLAAQVFACQLPAMVGLTLPMAVLFASLMTFAGLSSHGELLALKAGGISFLRVAIPVIVGGLVVSALTLGVNESLAPLGSARAFELVKSFRQQGKPLENLVFQIPESGTPRHLFHIRQFDPTLRRAEGVMVIYFNQDGSFSQLFEAEYADWADEWWVLQNPLQVVMTPQGQRKTRLDEVRVFVGKSADQLQELKQSPSEMSIVQLQRLLRQYQTLNLPLYPDQSRLFQFIHSRLAIPWCAVGFAMLGVALGQRPLRASTSVGFGLSLAIVFFYYLLFNTMLLMGERGLFNPWIAAWTPNAVLFAAGISLLYNGQK